MKAKQFDEAFDKGEDTPLHLDLDGASRPSILRQAIIKLRLSERLKFASDENGTDHHPVTKEKE